MPATLSSDTVQAKTTATALWVDGERFVTTGSSGHAVVLDSDRERNSAPGPVEMVLRSLCGCTATDVVVVLKKKRQPFTRVEVSAEAERASTPPTVLTRIVVRYRVEGDGLDAQAVERAVALSQEKYCSVMAMLRSTARITYEISLGPAQAAHA
jgi:putative redox protein